MKKALITGIGGQDGSYLAELLLEKGCEVYGIDLPDLPLTNLKRIADQCRLYHGSLLDCGWLKQVVNAVLPDECYHLAASSFVSYHFNQEAGILENNISGIHNLLSTLKEYTPHCRFFFSGTSEMFGLADHFPQSETTPFRPRSIYGISKLSGHHLVEYYRQHYGMFACTGILYNHESPRRGPAFVTRKITSGVARIKLGLEKKLFLGNLEAERDWGYAPDYVKAMWLMLQADGEARDYVISSGVVHSVREFAEAAFSAVELDYRDHVEIRPEFFREKDRIPLVGDARQIRAALGWKASKRFEDIAREMVREDMKLLTSGFGS
jgi:GDPmannose 4,6-dehydratase